MGAFAVLWALVVPPLQAPDEDVHLAYIQELVEAGELPKQDPRAPQLSTELVYARTLANTQDSIFHPDTQPASGAAAEAELAALGSGRPKDDGRGVTNASSSPPFAYAVLSVAYRLAGGSLFDRLFAVRVASALMLLVTTAGAWLLAGELFDRRRMPQLLCAATVGLWPMATFITASANVDGTLIAEWSLFAWLGVRLVRRGLSPGPAFAFGVLTGCALLTKATSLALLPPLVLVAALGGAAAWREDRRRALLALACLVLPLVLLGGSWAAVTRFGDRSTYPQVAIAVPGRAPNPREFLVYLWEFYLPRLPFMQDKRSLIPVIGDLPLYNTWLGQGWGVYGWVNVWFAHWTYKVFAAITLVVTGGFVASTVRSVRRRGSPEPATLKGVAVLLTMAIGLVLGVHLTDYTVSVTQGGPFAQGRYLLPVLPLAGLVVAGASNLTGRRQAVVAAGWMGGLVVFQLASLGLVVTRFYA